MHYLVRCFAGTWLWCGFDKYAHNVTNTPIIKEQTILKSIDHKVLHCYNKQNCNA